MKIRISLPIVLFLIFLTLKLAGIGIVANWSWLWIFSPLWIPIAIFFSFFIGMILFALITALIFKD